MSVELEGKVVVPGDKLGPADGFKCGSGCYTAGPYVYASVVGIVSLDQDTASAPQEGGDEEMVDCQPRVSVVRRKDRFAPVVPNTDNIVIAKVCPHSHSQPHHRTDKASAWIVRTPFYPLPQPRSQNQQSNESCRTCLPPRRSEP